MATRKKRKGGGSKLSRSEVITVRLDPRLRFAAELAARKHRRTLSSFIEWAIEEVIDEVIVGDKEESARWAMNHVWDVDEGIRFYNLAKNCSRILTHEEEILWKLIQDVEERYQKFLKDYKNQKSDFEVSFRPPILKWDRILRDFFEKMKMVAQGKLDEEELYRRIESRFF